MGISSKSIVTFFNVNGSLITIGLTNYIAMYYIKDIYFFNKLFFTYCIFFLFIFWTFFITGRIAFYI